MSMRKEVEKRVSELIDDGRTRMQTSTPYARVGWFTAATNVVELVTGGRGAYFENMRGLRRDDRPGVVSNPTLESTVALLQALLVDLQRGLLESVEYVVAAETFDDFLNHADGFHRASKAYEGGVLVSVVFEDTVRKLDKRAGGKGDGKLDSLIDGLVKVGRVTPVTGRRMKAIASLRNKALHGKPEDFDLNDVGDAIRTTRQLVELLHG